MAGLLAGAFSMAAGELVSVRAQDELVQRELQVERQELAEHPDAEFGNWPDVRGPRVSAKDADPVARIISRCRFVAFDTHALLELGIDPQSTGSAWQASIASFLSFAIGAFLPLIPWLFFGGTKAVVISICIGAVAAAALGAVIGHLPNTRGRQDGDKAAPRAVVAAGVTLGVGRLLGAAAS